MFLYCQDKNWCGWRHHAGSGYVKVNLEQFLVCLFVAVYAQLACVPVLTHWCRLAGRTDAQCASISSLTTCMRRQLLETSSTRLKAAKRSYRANNGQAPRWSQTWERAMELVQSQWSTQARQLPMLFLRMVPTGRLEVQPSTASGLKRNSRRTYNGSLEYRGMYSSS